MDNMICITNAHIFTGITTIPNGAVVIRDGLIADVVGRERFLKMNIPANTECIDAGGNTLCAGFIDTHIHGFMGYETSDAREESFLRMSEQLVSYGVTTFCPTIYTQEEDRFTESIWAGVRAMGQESGARIAGLHLEGPFISRKRIGAQEESSLKEADLGLMKKYTEMGRGCISLMTVAPELKHMRELALFCVREGITLSAGHTNAAYGHMLEGMQAGILHSTHFFNAMRPLHHRDPGCVGAILIHPEISCEIIADGHHVHPALIKLLYRNKPVDKIVLVTDSLGPTMQKGGVMRANREEVYFKDGVFYKKKDDVIAGSSLTMMKGIENLVLWGIPLVDAIMMATANPARVLGIDRDRGLLIPGHSADITVFDQNFRTTLTIVRGRIAFRE